MAPAVHYGLQRHELELTAGPFDVASLVGGSQGCLGLLVTSGLIMVQVGVWRARVAWLVGPRDLIRPWEMADVSLTQSSEWRALTDARMLQIIPDPQDNRARRQSRSSWPVRRAPVTGCWPSR